MEMIRLLLPRLTAAAGAEAVRDVVGALPGVDRVAVDLRERTATISYDATRVGAWDLVVAIEGQGERVGALLPHPVSRTR